MTLDWILLAAVAVGALTLIVAVTAHIAHGMGRAAALAEHQCPAPITLADLFKAQDREWQRRSQCHTDVVNNIVNSARPAGIEGKWGMLQVEHGQVERGAR